MNCRKIQDIIITDYVDGQLEEKRKYCIEEHLAHCQHCKEFSIKAREAVVNPFINIGKQETPEIIWDNLREAIISQQKVGTVKVGTDTNFLINFLRKLVSVPTFTATFIPKPVFALTSIVTLIFMMGILPQFMINNPAVKIDEQGQIEYLSYLTGSGGDVPASDSADLGTPIEKYFL